MKIAFWNVNAGKSSWGDRLKVLEKWCDEMVPDLLFLEEISHTLAGDGVTDVARSDESDAGDQSDDDESDDESGEESDDESGGGSDDDPIVSLLEQTTKMQMIGWAETKMRITAKLDLGARIPLRFKLPRGVKRPADGLNQMRSTKNLCVLCRGDERQYTARATSFEILTGGGRNRALKAKRQAVEVSNEEMGFTVVGLHANASPKGGKMASKRSARLIGDSQYDYVIGGDFNYGATKAAALIAKYRKEFHNNVNLARPLSWQRVPRTGFMALNFSQWKKGGESDGGKPIRDGLPPPAQRGSRMGELGEYVAYLIAEDKWTAAERAYAVATHLKTLSTGTRPIVPNPQGVIDFMLHREGRSVTSLPVCNEEMTWALILQQFDHCPVCYDVVSDDKGKKRTATSSSSTSKLPRKQGDSSTGRPR
jgi:hypothetical protein